MIAPSIRPISLAARALALGLLLAAPAALAQYRPPPMSDAERFLTEGEAARAEAAKASQRGAKAEAEAKLKESIAAFQKSLEEDPDAITAATQLAQSAATLKDWPLIIKTLPSMREKYPKDPDLAYQLGVAYLRTNRLQDAEPLLELAVSSERKDLFLANFYLGSIDLLLKAPEKAIRQLGRYLELRPNDPKVTATDYLVHESRGKAYLLLRNAPEARASFYRALETKPDSLQARLGLAQVLELDEKLAEATAAFEQLRDASPGNVEVKEQLGRLYLRQGKVKEAEGIALDLQASQASATAHLLLGDVLLARKQYDQAEEHLKESLRLAPNQPAATISLAVSLQNLNRSDEAIRLLQEATAGGSKNADLFAALGTLLRRAGSHPKAVKAHEEVVRLTPASARGHLLLAADAFHAAQWDQAIREYAAALERNAEPKTTRHWLAAALGRRARAALDANHPDDAEADLRRAVATEPSALAPVRSLTALLLTRQKYAEARVVIQKGAALPDAGFREQLLLGYSLLAMGEDAKAAATFEAADKLATEPADRGQVAAGQALVQLRQGDLDAAIDRLSAPGQQASKSAAANLAAALLRRAADRIHRGDSSGAAKDLEQLAQAPRAPELERRAELLRALLAIDQARFDAAATALKAAFSPAEKSLEALAARPLVEAFLEYRRGRSAEARKRLAAVPKSLNYPGLAELARAIDRREGELAFKQGSSARAEKALRDAAEADPGNPFLQNNLACALYLGGGAGVRQAVSMWEAVGERVPEALLNLGLAAHAERREPRRAADYYGRYLATRGQHLAQAREWKERLEAIYGLSSGGSPASPENPQ